MSFKDTLFSVKQTINCGGRIIDFTETSYHGYPESYTGFVF